MFAGFARDALKSSKGKARKKSKGGAEDDEEDDFFKSLAPSKLPRFVELLKFKAVTPGMKLLGVVTEVRATELAVSLPHGLVGRYVWCLVLGVWSFGTACRDSCLDSVLTVSFRCVRHMQGAVGECVGDD